MFIIIKGCLAKIAIISISVVLLYTLFVFSGGGIYICGGYAELVSLDILKKYGRASSAMDISEVILNMNRSDDCCTPDQYEAVFRICQRHPETKKQIVEFAVKNVLDGNTPHFNRVQLIRLVETLTTKTFEESCYPMYGWTENEIPEEARHYMESGIEYIREWWDRGNISYREIYEPHAFTTDIYWLPPGEYGKWKPSPFCIDSVHSTSKELAGTGN